MRKRKKKDRRKREKRLELKRENWNKVLFFINFVVTISCYF